MPENQDRTTGFAWGDWLDDELVIDDTVEIVDEPTQPVAPESIIGRLAFNPEASQVGMVQLDDETLDAMRRMNDLMERNQQAPRPRMARPVRPVAPAPEPWRARRNDLVRVTANVGSLREGELAYIDEDSTYSGCGDSACSSCANLSLTLLRVTRPDSRTEYDTYYLSARAGEVEPVAPDAFGQRVRCQRGGLDHGDSAVITGVAGHPHNGDCVSPVRVLDHFPNDLMPAFRQAWAPELQARATARQELLSRAGNLAIGQRYMIQGSSSNYYGYIAEIVELPAPDDDRIACHVYYPDGERCRTFFNMSIFSLGGRWYQHMMGAEVPPFIRFPVQPRYSGAVTVSDHAIGDSADAHDCDDHCFDYGCSARGNNDDDDVDYVGDVPIHSYSYRPNLIFSGAGPVYLGAELELSTGHYEQGARQQQAAAKIITESEIGHLVYLKQDGSISGHGFEAVFHPMSYDFLVENWPEDLLRRMRNAGAVPHDSCGMHVHVSRSGFTDGSHAYRWIKFMYRNQRIMSRMARRNPSSWGSFDRPDERAAAKWHAKGGYGANNRYTAINCIPRETFEVRIFASTLNRTRFLGSLGLVDASVEYTRQINAHKILTEGAWEFDPFREYVSSFNKYRPLQQEMARILA